MTTHENIIEIWKEFSKERVEVMNATKEHSELEEQANISENVPARIGKERTREKLESTLKNLHCGFR